MKIKDFSELACKCSFGDCYITIRDTNNWLKASKFKVGFAIFSKNLLAVLVKDKTL